MNRNPYNLNGAAKSAPAIPHQHWLGLSAKAGSFVGGFAFAFMLGAMGALGYTENNAKVTDLVEFSKKVNEKIDPVARDVADIKTGMKKDRAIVSVQMEALQDDLAGLKGENRNLAVAIEDLKQRVAAPPPPLPTKKAASRKTAAKATPASLLVMGH